MKKIIYLLLVAASLYAATISPFGIIKTKERFDSLDKTLRQYVTVKSQLEGAKMSVIESQNAFVEGREFEIAYNDVERLLKVLDNVLTVTVSSVNIADPKQYYIAGSNWEAGTECQAVIISLAVDDTVAALKVIDRMELPIYSVTITEPNIVNVTFLTGGDYSNE